MFLATTALTRFWDTAGPILFLGPWCTLHSERSNWAALEYQILPNPWDNREKFFQAGLHCQSVADLLLTELTPYLNSVNGVHFDARYWRILVGPWILWYVSALYDRYVYLKEAFQAFPALKTIVLKESDYFTIHEFAEHSRMIDKSHLYNLQLFSQIIRTWGYEFPEKSALPKGRPTAPRQAKPYLHYPRAFLKGAISRVRGLGARYLLTAPRVIVHPINFDRWPRLKLSATSGFCGRFAFESFPPGWRFEADSTHPARRELASLSRNTDEFGQVLAATLPLNFPTLYLEGYRESRRFLLNMCPRKQMPRVLVSVASLWSDEYGKFQAAEMSTRGGRIICVQHGSNYGAARYLDSEWHERQIADRFCCWGWADQESDPKLQNLPHPKLDYARHLPGDSDRHTNILLVGTCHPGYLHMFQSAPRGRQMQNYIDATLDFLQGIGPEYQRMLIYRGNKAGYEWDIAARIKEKFPVVTIDDHARSFYRQMRQARVLVFDHPGTTFLEAMAANMPHVLFYDPQHWEMRATAKPYFDLLFKSGLLFYTPRTAAAKIQEVYHDVDRWWFSDQVQQGRQKFAAHFALGHKAWNKSWVDLIRQELALS
jgi:putative transferase (TIGR04331 family)